MDRADTVPLEASVADRRLVEAARTAAEHSNLDAVLRFRQVLTMEVPRKNRVDLGPPTQGEQSGTGSRGPIRCAVGLVLLVDERWTMGDDESRQASCGTG